jgi:hypothetical protein
MSRYLLFCFDDWYPGGGMKDYVGSYPTRDEALTEAFRLKRDHFQIVDILTGRIYEP